MDIGEHVIDTSHQNTWAPATDTSSEAFSFRHTRSLPLYLAPPASPAPATCCRADSSNIDH